MFFFKFHIKKKLLALCHSIYRTILKIIGVEIEKDRVIKDQIIIFAVDVALHVVESLAFERATCDD